MSIRTTAANLARRSFARAVAYAREFVLIASYAAICAAVAVPVLVATGAGLYWSITTLGLEGRLRTGSLVVGVVVVMFEFAMLHRFVQTLGYAMFGPTRGRKV